MPVELTLQQSNLKNAGGKLWQNDVKDGRKERVTFNNYSKGKKTKESTNQDNNRMNERNSMASKTQGNQPVPIIPSTVDVLDHHRKKNVHKVKMPSLEYLKHNKTMMEANKSDIGNYF